MKDRSPNTLITPTEIIDSPPETINSVDELRVFLQIRGPLFFNRLAVVTRGTRLGRESIMRDTSGLVDKVGWAGNNSVFTGHQLCSFASLALYDGLQPRAKNMHLDVVHIDSDLVAENWDHPAFEAEELPHQVLKATEEETGNTLFFDPTYRQINHRQQETILATDVNTMQTYYRRSFDPNFLRSTLDTKTLILKHFQEQWGVTEKKYQTLLASLN